MRRHVLVCFAAFVIAAGPLSTRTWSAGATDDFIPGEADRKAPVDYGYGPGVRPPPVAAMTQQAIAPLGPQIPSGANANTAGVFGAAVAWPVISIHVVLLPDGRVMNYGTNQTGQQGAQFNYDVWDPSAGTGSSAHLVLPNVTATDIFCSNQSVIWGSDQVLITGGDLTINGKRNFSNNHTTIFDPAGNTISSGPLMQFPRWYPSIVALPTGEMLTLGGRQALGVPATTPEVFTPGTGWRTLTGAASIPAFGNVAKDWYFPRGWLAPNGKVVVLTADGKMYAITPAGTGTIASLPATAPTGSNMLPTVMFQPGKLLSVRSGAKAVVVNINASTPTVTTTGSLSQERLWSSGTVMADGKVLVTGGSLVANQLTGTAFAAEIWDPATGQWTLGASATKPRLYHSNALLLPDASVLTGGGGAPGPVKNLNAEIYYPPYLYTSSGQPAARPTLVSAPTSVSMGQQLTATVGTGNQISRVTFIRTGSSTHSSNLDQRFFDLPFTQNGQQITATLPTNSNVLLPGNYMLFVFQNGAPSIAKIVLVLA